MATIRATFWAEADDLSVLDHEARRRGMSLDAYLCELVRQQSASIRVARRPRFGVVDRPVSIAAAMTGDPDAPGDGR